jgi:hypothetical protein
VNIRIEFSGIAKELAETDELALSLPEGTRYRQIVKELALLYPAMVNILIAPSGDEFLSSVMFVIDGDLANPVMLMDESPHEGECIHLMSVITGG